MRIDAMGISISVNSISKKYDRRFLFRDLSLVIGNGDSLCIKGPNGSGKSTLLRILAFLTPATKGTVSYSINSLEIDRSMVPGHIGFLSPQIEPYGEMTALENIMFALRRPLARDIVEGYLQQFGLFKHRNVAIQYFSTGLKQRLKYLISIINDPDILFLDEPGSNLDISGKNTIYAHINECKSSKIVFVATNDQVEEKLCDRIITLD